MNKEEIEQLKKKYTVTPSEVEEISKLVFTKMTYEKTPVKNPIMVIVGGQPGAGKSGLIDKTWQEMPNAVVLDVDDFRYFHPQIEEILEKYPNDLATFTIQFVNTMFGIVVKQLEDAGYNLIAQKTLKDDEVIYDTLVGLKEAGYTIVVRVLAVSELESKLSGLERSVAVKKTVGYCRWNSIKNQDYAINGLPPTTKKIFESDYCDVIQVFKRNTIPTNASIVYSKAKESSAKVIEKSQKHSPNLFMGDFGTENYADEIDAIMKNRDKNTHEDILLFMARILLAKQNVDEGGTAYLEELENYLVEQFLKLNDLPNGYMDNNIKLELAKEVMARKVADVCKKGFDPNDEKTKLILEEEKEMNKFNAFVIDKIINTYGNEIKNREV